jgi:hypothetical protein
LPGPALVMKKDMLLCCAVALPLMRAKRAVAAGVAKARAMRIVSPIYVGSGKDVPAPAIFRGCSHGASQSRVVIPAQPGNQTIARLPLDSRSRFARPE